MLLPPDLLSRQIERVVCDLSIHIARFHVVCLGLSAGGIGTGGWTVK